MNWPTDNLNTQCRKWASKNVATKIFLTQARDETDLQSELDSAKQEIAKLQDELIKAEVENKLRQQFNVPPMQKMLMQGKRARGEELDQEVSCFFLIIDIVTMFFCQLVNKKRKVVIPKVVRLTVR